MLIIRNEQLVAFRRAAAERFVAEVAGKLAERHPERVAALGMHEVVDRVRRSIDRASRYGLERRIDVASFAELAVLVGPRFDEYPAIHDILDDDDIWPEDRIDVALRDVPPDEWERAASEPYDDNDNADDEETDPS